MNILFRANPAHCPAFAMRKTLSQRGFGRILKGSSPSMTSVPNEPSRPSPKALALFWAVIGGIVLLILAGSFWLRHSLAVSFEEPPPPDLGNLEVELEGLERTGLPVNTATLHGKVRVFAHLYTVCPHGCAAVLAEMVKLNERFRGNPYFHQISIAVIPERDSPELFKAHAEALAVRPTDPWWFLTGKREDMEQFMVEGLKLERPKPIPPEERLNPLDLYEHDLRIVLVDRRGTIRGYYSVFDPSDELAKLMREKLQRDVQRLLENPTL